MADTQHKPPAHDTHRRVAGQYPVYPSSCCGRGARGTVCALCGEGQHLAWCHTRALCHFAEQEPP